MLKICKSGIAVAMWAVVLGTMGCSDDDSAPPPPAATATATSVSTSTATAVAATRTASAPPTQTATATTSPSSATATATPVEPTATATGESQATETPTAEAATPTATPDGPPEAGKIVFSVTDLSTFFADLFVINTDGSGRTNITNSVDDSEGQPRWSPDGTKIAFTCNAGICVANADGSGRTVAAAGTGLFYPSWSHDGAKIAFTNLRSLEVVNADGTERTVVLPSAGEDIEALAPTWSPSNDKLAFCSNRTATGGESSLEIYVVGIDGSDLQRLTDDQTENSHTDWSLADVIAFDSTRATVGGIFTIGPDGGNEQDLVDGSFPGWNADGSRLVYFTFGGLRVADADGSNDQAVPNTTFDDVSPDLH